MARTPPSIAPTDATSRDKTRDGASKTPSPADEAARRGVVRQRDHIKALTGDDPLRGGIAD